MEFIYPVADYLHHQHVWQAKYHAIDRVFFNSEETFLGSDDSALAEVMRIRYMMITEGVSASEEGKKAKVFHFVQMFIAHHIDALFKAGLVRIHDGVQAVVLAKAGMAIHAAFNFDPPPMPKDVSVDSVITAAALLKP